MRSIHVGLVVVVALLVFGCGGGGTSPVGDGPSGITGSTAYLQGKVTSRDGSTTDLGGIQVFDIDTQQAVTTNDNGLFALDVRADSRVRLRFEDPRSSIPHYGDPSAGYGVDVEGDRVDVGPFEPDEECWVEVEIGHEGDILECWVEHGDGGHEGEGGMWPGDPVGGIGSVEVDEDGECLTFAVEFRGLEGPDVYEVLLRNPEDEEYSLGTFPVSAEGTGTFELQWCQDDPLPFGAETLEDLCGVEILILNSSDEVIFYGKLPCGGPQHGDWGPCPGQSLLLPPGATGEPDAMGFAGSMEFEGCTYITVEAVFREAPTSTLTAVVIAPSGAEAVLGTLEDLEKGYLHLALEYCEGDALPLGATSLDDYAEHTIEVRDGEGTVVLEGAFPVPPDECGMPMPGEGPGIPDCPDVPWPQVPDPDDLPPPGENE